MGVRLILLASIVGLTLSATTQVCFCPKHFLILNTNMDGIGWCNFTLKTKVVIIRLVTLQPCSSQRYLLNLYLSKNEENIILFLLRKVFWQFPSIVWAAINPQVTFTEKSRLKIISDISRKLNKQIGSLENYVYSPFKMIWCDHRLIKKQDK